MALRQAGFREPECFRGLVLRRRQEHGVFTGEPRVFYHLERGGGSGGGGAEGGGGAPLPPLPMGWMELTLDSHSQLTKEFHPVLQPLCSRRISINGCACADLPWAFTIAYKRSIGDGAQCCTKSCLYKRRRLPFYLRIPGYRVERERFRRLCT